MLHFSGAANLLQGLEGRTPLHALLRDGGQATPTLFAETQVIQGLFPIFRGFSDSGQSSWEGEEDGSATDLDAGAWLCHGGWCQELGLVFWKERG